MYHFAYGSNMNINELKKYCSCKNIKIIGTGYLDNYIFRYRLIYGKLRIKAKANIEPRKGSKVYGLIVNIKGSLPKYFFNLLSLPPVIVFCPVSIKLIFHPKFFFSKYLFIICPL